MGLSEKILTALQVPLSAECVRLDDDDGISGFVVSRRFENMSTLDRQQLIDEALRSGPDPLSHDEQRQIILIAGLTPREYDSASPQIRVHRIREQNDGSLEILLHGGYSDAMYVRDVLENEKGVQTTEPEQCPGAIGILVKFSAKGTAEAPLTEERATRVLRADQYIQVMQNA